MRRMMVGVDGSDASLTALAWSSDVAERSSAELTAVRVFEPTQAELPPDRLEDMQAEQRQQLIEWCERIPGARAVTDHVVRNGGSPPDVLLEAAAADDVDMLVVGGRGIGGFPDLHVGSVAHHLTHHTTVPLAIVPADAPGRLGHVALGVDGSDESLTAARFAADIAGATGVQATAVFAFEPFAEWVPRSDEDSWYQHAKSDVRSWTSAVADAGVDLEIVVDRDINPVAAIERALEEHTASTAVVGTRGLGGFPGLRLGRIPLQLVHHTGHPVVVVPPSADDPT